MRYLILFFLHFFISNLYSQTSNLESKFHRADSIVLIKHLSTGLPVIVIDLAGKESKSSKQRRLMNGNKLNKAIVLKRIKINSNQINSLLDILIAKHLNIPAQTIQCFMPRHTILIYRQHKISYLDLCFECLDFEKSADIKLGETYFNKSKWTRLYNFFSELKLITDNDKLIDE